MAKLLHAVVLGLVGAGVVHIAVLLMVPHFSVSDAWSVLSAQGNYYTFVRIAPPGKQPIVRSLDPSFDAVACRFDLREGAVRISGSASVPYWSISVYDRAGQNVFSFNDRSASQGLVDFVVATPVQMVDLRNALPPEFSRSVFVEADIAEGIAVVRLFAPDDSWEPRVTSYLKNLDCKLTD